MGGGVAIIYSGKAGSRKPKGVHDETQREKGFPNRGGRKGRIKEVVSTGPKTQNPDARNWGEGWGDPEQ